MRVARPTTVAAYLAQLPPPRRKELERVRAVVKKHLPAGYEESFTSGMIVWVVPLERYRDTYNGHALWYAALAAQKNHLTLHLMNAYGDPPRAASPIKTERSPPRSAGRVRVGPTFLLDDSTRDRGVRTASPHPSPADRRGGRST